MDVGDEPEDYADEPIRDLADFTANKQRYEELRDLFTAYMLDRDVYVNRNRQRLWDEYYQGQEEYKATKGYSAPTAEVFDKYHASVERRVAGLEEMYRRSQIETLGAAKTRLLTRLMKSPYWEEQRKADERHQAYLQAYEHWRLYGKPIDPPPVEFQSRGD